MEQTLKQTIRLPQAIALYIGAVLGSGILLTPGLAAQISGPASLIAWGVMVLLVLPMALVMGWLSSSYPHAGGVAYFVSKAFGKTASMHIGWYFLMSVVMGAPIASLTGAGYLAAALGLNRTATVWIAVSILLIALTINYRGMKLSGQIQVMIVIGIITVLILSISYSFPFVKKENFTPWMPHGWMSIGQTISILFWCFIGWEAVSHLSEEFVDPKRDTVKAVSIAALIVGLLYFLTAFTTVGTRSYLGSQADTALIWIMKQNFGPSGSVVIGGTSFLICTATVITYVGAASRLAFALAREGHAPRPMARLSRKHQTPVGGLCFLAGCFTLILFLYAFGNISLSTLILFPNATFILTYLAGCAAGIRLLQHFKWGRQMSWLSLILTALALPFAGWGIIYPVFISLIIWMGQILSQNNTN
ncbi:amino acid permease [Thermoflavimicrobium dichotomicum]|uniref:Amino acid efflux transporter n=1 Tax=Thermoflavimicrobium dichotomicum TaxID=46223 RepID=A0A1I3QGJ8_9BACL|nr:amino acid permease [Thermoflavimicrobium dichotomicum]SFJ32900.1 amino acid efflux transporter [Thermoflavimicrobium dichotomicum]